MRTNSMSLARVLIWEGTVDLHPGNGHHTFFLQKTAFQELIGERKRRNLPRGRTSYLGSILGLRLGSGMTYKEMEARECKDTKIASADSTEQ